MDGIGILGKIVLEKGGELIGAWTTKGYDYEESQATFEHEGETYFMGLALDEDNQSEMTDERLGIWLPQIINEYKFPELV